jgi:hypothetical protein
MHFSPGHDFLSRPDVERFICPLLLTRAGIGIEPATSSLGSIMAGDAELI